MYDIEFKGETCEMHGTYIRQRPNITVPVEEVEQYRVAGRDGVLTGRRYISPMDLYIPMNFRVYKEFDEEWPARFRDLRTWLHGPGELIQSDDDRYYLKVLNVQIEESERIIKKYGRFSAHFTCDPYFYRVDGKEQYAIDDPRILYNPYEECHPVYVFTGTAGARTLTVNGTSVTVTVSGNIVVDTDRMITYRKADMKPSNTRLSGDYEALYLVPGANTIEGTGVKIIPNWRTR